jgi:predicted metal-dependent hydrolase
MRKLSRTIVVAIIATGIAGGMYALFGSSLMPSALAAEHWKEHPRLEKAHKLLKEAIAALKAAPHDFNGHREDAVKASEAAQKQLEICAEFQPKAEPDLSPLDKHPKIEKALEAIKDAHAYIKEAPHDFNGHRVEALGILDTAIHQLELCLEEKK